MGKLWKFNVSYKRGKKNRHSESNTERGGGEEGKRVKEAMALAWKIVCLVK